MKTDKHLTTAAKQALNEQARDLDAETLSRLNRIRQSALAAHQRPAMRIWNRSTTVFASVACMVAVIGLSLRLYTPQENLPAPTSDLLELEMLAIADGEDLDLISDLDFYLWLEQELDES